MNQEIINFADYLEKIEIIDCLNHINCDKKELDIWQTTVGSGMPVK